MITKKQIEQKIADLKKEFADVSKSKDEKDQKKIKRMKSMVNKKTKFYKTCILYVESEPTEEYIKKQKAQVLVKMENIKKAFKDALSQSQYKEAFAKTEKSFEKELGMTKLKDQLKHLDFLIN